MLDKQTIINFHEIIQTKFKLSKELLSHYEKILTPNFNSFDFWWIDENKVSDILAFFLDPYASHSQGKIFLNVFIKAMGIKRDYDNDTIEVTREFPTNENRRIDIVINFNNREYNKL